MERPQAGVRLGRIPLCTEARPDPRPCPSPPSRAAKGDSTYTCPLSTRLIHGWVQPRAAASSDCERYLPDSSSFLNLSLRASGDSLPLPPARRAGREGGSQHLRTAR